ncbi:uncharacterized protein TNCV_5060221 [Trichonephila clavipes]|nr:uncharacterized protein TNCV_5060221 [Trichonephila clavipes]
MGCGKENIDHYFCMETGDTILDRKWNGRSRSNFELYHSYKKSGIVNFIKIQGIKWSGQVVRMDEDRTTKKVCNGQPIGTRRKDKPNLIRIDDLEKYLIVLRTLAE